MRKISSDIDPQEFFNNFIATRTPAIFSDTIKDDKWRGNEWSNTYLINKCGNSRVKVEHRASDSDRYGLVLENRILFKEFINSMENEEKGNKLYLTTQDLTYDKDGRPNISSEPVSSLIGEFPWIPKVMGNLIVANVNLWFGSSSDSPATSGLHHDFHDNLYILLRGKKTISLFIPSKAHDMYTFGTIEKIHPNGRINYLGQSTNADGSNPKSMLAHEASELLMQAAERLLHAEAKQEAVYEAEDELDEALEAVLNAETEEDEADCSDDYGSDDDNDDDEGEEKDVNEIVAHRKRGLVSEKEEGIQSNPKQMKRSHTVLPDNFSQVDTALSDQVLMDTYPRYLEARDHHSMTVDLHAGEMLYIPCGWFHEVRSFGKASTGGHMAFNYWFHPPDTTNYNHPYTSNFWSDDFNSRTSHLR